MSTILLTGIPGTGKTELVDRTKVLCRTSYETDVDSISLAELVARGARRFWNTSPKEVYLLDPEYQRPLRYAAILEAALQLAHTSTERHVIIDTPMTMFARGGKIPDIIFSSDDISILHSGRSLDYVVTLIDDPHEIAERLKETSYPKEVPSILNWSAMEVNVTRSALNQRSMQDGRCARRHLVIPKNHSEETLTKLLNDDNAPICYLAGPITTLHPKDNDSDTLREEKVQAKKQMRTFRDRLQEYCVVVAPMELADTGATAEEIAHTVHRDLHWFVTNADLTIAYFPGMYSSEGTAEEMRATLRIAKPLVLIRPKVEGKEEVFGIKPPFHFETEDEFFEAVQNSRSNGDPKYDVLRRLLDPKQNVPRYAHLRPHAIAVDIYDHEGKHLLIQQGADKPYAGKWMLVAGKKDDKNNPDFREIQREVFEEVGLQIEGMDQSYKIYRVDYAKPKEDGTAPQYVRIYGVKREQALGTPHRNNATSHDEVGNVSWFTLDNILEMGDQIVPATLQYFKDLKNKI